MPVPMLSHEIIAEPFDPIIADTLVGTGTVNCNRDSSNSIAVRERGCALRLGLRKNPIPTTTPMIEKQTPAGSGISNVPDREYNCPPAVTFVKTWNALSVTTYAASIALD